MSLTTSWRSTCLAPRAIQATQRLIALFALSRWRLTGKCLCDTTVTYAKHAAPIIGTTIQSGERIPQLLCSATDVTPCLPPNM